MTLILAGSPGNPEAARIELTPMRAPVNLASSTSAMQLAATAGPALTRRPLNPAALICRP